MIGDVSPSLNASLLYLADSDAPEITEHQFSMNGIWEMRDTDNPIMIFTLPYLAKCLIQRCTYEVNYGTFLVLLETQKKVAGRSFSTPNLRQPKL